MSITSGFKKYKNYKTDSNGDHQLQSFWTSSDSVDGNITEASTRANLVNGETLTTSLGKIKKFFSDLGTSAFKNTTDTYSGTGTDPVTGKAVKEAIDSLDVTGASNIAASKTIKAWSETDGKVSITTQDIAISNSQISGLGTASTKDVPSSGDASSTEVVMGDDSRLTDARPASDVSAWAKASTKPTYTASEVGAIATTAKGANNGVAELDSAGKVPSSQLPSYVDDVLEYNSMSDFPTTGESGKIYIAKDTNKTYRWSGTTYVEISESLALGETSSTAYRGDRGKIAYDHSQTTSGNPHNVTKSDVGLSNVDNTSDADKPISTATQSALSDKVDKVTGKGLSTNDYTTTEKDKLAGIESGAQVNPTIDSALSGSSTNAVQNKVVKSALDTKADSEEVEGLKTATGNPITLTDGSETYAQGLSVKLEPKQDLHGYDFPWVGGAGKNLFPLSVESVKDFNSDKQWSGNSFTLGNVTLTLLTDNDGNCIGIDFDGTASSFVRFIINAIPADFPDGRYLVNGVNGGSVSTYIGRFVWKENSDKPVYNGDDTAVTISSTDSHSGNFGQFRFDIQSGVTLNHVKIYPQIRLSTETDPTFAPYSNICPISGYEGVEAEDVGKNKFDISNIESGYVNSNTGEIVSGYNHSGYMRVKPNKPYTIKGFGWTGANAGAVYDSNKNYVSGIGVPSYPHTLSIPQNGAFVMLSIDTNEANEPQFEEGSTATPFEPYQSRTASVTFGQTVYGGMSNLTDGGTDDEFENLDDFTDIAFHANQGGTYAYEVYIGTPDKKYGVDNLLASLMPVKTSFTDVAEFSIRGFGNDSDIAIKFPKSVVNTPELAKQWCIDNGLQIAFEKATPTTIATPKTDLKLLQDTNNLTTNGTTITLDYIPNNSIGDAVKASEEYTDRVVERVDLSEYMKKGVDYVTAGQLSGSTLGTKATAEGQDTVASGTASHAEGVGTRANTEAQTVIGKYNVEDTNHEYAFIIGGGSSDSSRSNLFGIKWDGTMVLNGSTVGIAENTSF